MKAVTAEAMIRCGHDGRITNEPSQRWVTIETVPILVDHDPEGRKIIACPNFGPTMKPCAKTLAVKQGYSTWVMIDNHRMVLSHLDGLTDGTVPGTVHYQVRDPGQHFVEVDR
ncbi:hypothetical protein [Microlunatus speluncae]|uniref:hypothetical protein n=1 Tax=Microlunatus speluncae TaxID=2594267 RepID=UPI0012660E2F|nr:hypothetical protein [Microlunatus speluncae]